MLWKKFKPQRMGYRTFKINCTPQISTSLLTQMCGQVSHQVLGKAMKHLIVILILSPGTLLLAIWSKWDFIVRSSEDHGIVRNAAELERETGRTQDTLEGSRNELTCVLVL